MEGSVEVRAVMGLLKTWGIKGLTLQIERYIRFV